MITRRNATESTPLILIYACNRNFRRCNNFTHKSRKLRVTRRNVTVEDRYRDDLIKWNG